MAVPAMAGTAHAAYAFHETAVAFLLHGQPMLLPSRNVRSRLHAPCRGFLSGRNGGNLMKYPILFGCLAAAFTVTAVAADRDDFRAHGPFTRTPIKHLVVIFQENISYDHYF